MIKATLALLLAALAAAAPSDKLFDSGKAAPLRLPPAPAALKGEPVKPPQDLVDAGAVWNHQAQLAKLRAAQPQPKSPFTFAVIGDVEEGRFPWQSIFNPKGGSFKVQLDLIQAGPSDFLIQLGDIVSKGVPERYRKLVSFLNARMKLPFISVIGNHDRSRPNGDADKTLYQTVFGAGDHVFDYNGWRFITLDTADRKLTKAQLEWLAKTIDSPLPSLIFTHVPPKYLKGKLKNAEGKAFIEDAEAKEFNMSGWFEEGSAEFGRLMALGKVKRVYMGHIHAFGVAEQDGVRYVLTGGGGSPLYPLPPTPNYPKRKFAHFIEVTAGPGTLKEEVVAVDGTRFFLP